MEVMEEYKNTESGTIPIDWNLVALGDVVTIKRGGSPRPIQEFLTSSFDGINWIKIGDTSPASKYIKSTVERIIKEGANYSRFVNCGDLLLSNSMSFGRPYILKINGCIHDGWLVLQNYNSTFDTEYLFYALSSKYVLSQYISKASGSSVLNLNKEIVSTVKVLLPENKQEQTAIATALSDTDELIEGLEKLIEKKRNIKQGVMQELLKPKEGWFQSTIGEIAIIKKGEQLNKDTLSTKGTYPVMNGGIQPSGYTDKWNQKSGTIIISEGGNSCGFVNFMESKFWQGGHCYSLETKINKYFLYHLLKYNEKLIMALRVGSGLPNIQRARLFEFILHYPAHSMQTQIAKIINDIDFEIESLELKLKKQRMIKQGMMQVLLTGKIRLV